MKNIIFATALMALNASAHTITGTPVLPGTLKYKMVVNTVKTTCKIKIERVRNLSFEDSYGNPGYTVRMNASLDGSDYERNLKVRFSQDFNLTNMFTVGNTTEVRDYDYFSQEGATLKIKTDGRLKEVSFPFNGQKITCLF